MFQRSNEEKIPCGGFSSVFCKRNVAIVVAICSVIVYLISKEDLPQEVMCSKGDVIDFFNQFWEWRLEQSPEFATTIGNHTFSKKLESYSLMAFKERKQASTEFLNTAIELLEHCELDEDLHLNLKLFISDLQTYLNGLKYMGYLFPINFLEGVHMDFETVISNMPMSTAEDYRKIIARYKAFPQQAIEIIEVLREGIKLKATNHELSMKGVLKQFDDLQTKTEDSVFYKPFLNIPNSISETESKSLQKDGQNAIVADLLPAFKRLRNFIETEYLKHLRHNIAVSSLPNGAEFYQACLDFHLGFHITPQEVHKMGLNEVERIGKEMDIVIKDLELKMPRKEFSEKIRDDIDFYFKSKEELLEAYRGIVFNLIHPKLSILFKHIPKLEMKVEPSRESMAKGPAAFYLAGTPDGKRPGIFYVNTASVEAAPKYEMMTLALHEGEPGHHLQISYMMEHEALPHFRRYCEDSKYAHAPSRFPLHTAFIEGWGLYSEFLGYELGMYDDPYFLFGHLSFEMFRACRLVVDTGIHALGWSREQAIAFMLENTAAHRENIENEVDRYITWPGQACAYKVGEMKIKQLREMAESKLGPKFDVREFHDTVLRSAGPLNILEAQVEKFIKAHSNF